MIKKHNLFITFLISFGSYIIYVLAQSLGNSMLSRNDILSSYKELIVGILFIVLMFSLYRKRINESFKSFIKDFKSNWLKILLVSGILIGLEIGISLLLQHFNIYSGNQLEAANELKHSGIPTLIYFAIVGTIVEECCFRLPYTMVDNNNKLVTYIFYSIVFASIHLLMTTSLLSLLYIIPYLLLSFGIGYGFYKTDNILMSTIVHIINNCIGIMLILL